MNEDGETALLRPMLWPFLALFAFCLAACIVLTLDLVVPVGSFYWELATYEDAARRIAAGQLHSVDYFAPYGALGYHLFSAGKQFFPSAHPLLLAQWSVLVITAPAMLLVALDTARRSPATAWALIVPFILFSALPFNLIRFYPDAGIDGFGIHGRQAAMLLYILAAALILARNRAVLAIVCAVTISALFFLDPTGFLAAVLIFLHAALAGRIGWGVLLATLLGFYGAVGSVEYLTGHVVAYLQEALSLLESDSGRLLETLEAAASLEFRTLAAAGVLLLVLFWFEREGLAIRYEDARIYFGRTRALNTVFDSPLAWLATSILACALLDFQNPGSHAFLALWPALWLILQHAPSGPRSYRAAVLVLCAAVALPPVIELLDRTGRAAIAAPASFALSHDHLNGLGNVSASREIFGNSQALAAHYVRHRRSYMDLAEAGRLPDPLLHANPAFQLVWLKELDRLATAILEWEQTSGRRLETVAMTDAADPLAAMLDRAPVPGLAVGINPERGSEKRRSERIAALAEADAIFLPRCPETVARLRHRTMAMAALEGRQAIEITPCYTMMLKRLEPAGEARNR